MSKHYHLIGIGGIGMGTLASLLLDKGHTVSGSDLKDNELTLGLRKRGVCISIGHRTGNIVKNIDTVVYSSAIRMNNPELIESESRNILVLRRAQGNVSRFNQILAQYQHAPEVTRSRMYLDTQEQIMSSVSKVIVDQKNGSNLLYLPLDKLMATTGANAPPATPAVTPPAQPNATPTVAPNTYTDARARDDSRTRDRDSR